MLSEGEMGELLPFLGVATRPDVKGGATGYLLGLSGDSEGRRLICSQASVLRGVLALTSDPSIAVAKDCYHTLVNLSADAALQDPLLATADLLPALLRRLLDPAFVFSDRVCSILANLSRPAEGAGAVLQAMRRQDVGLDTLVDLFCSEADQSRAARLHYLGPLLSNLTQLPHTRRFILDRDRCVVQRLLPYTQYSQSTIRRGGVIGTLRNCCFNHAHHEWLLSDAVDIVPFLLLPLAGGEELSEEENEGLPVDLQYLPADKQREDDPDLRKMLIETLLLLTATKLGRQILKQKNVYPIMREFHNWEKEPHVVSVCEKLVQVLIGDEPDGGMENLMEVEIPEELEEKLREADVKEEEQIEREKKELMKQQEEEEKKREEETREQKEK